VARQPRLADNGLLKSFGEAVRARRQALGLSQEALADVSGLHRTYIGGIERGERNVSLLNIARLAEALDTTPGRLIDRTG
jgi:transcriptional regulator with XRE-family HTH domain